MSMEKIVSHYGLVEIKLDQADGLLPLDERQPQSVAFSSEMDQRVSTSPRLADQR
jgi:hypothetical protein